MSVGGCGQPSVLEETLLTRLQEPGWTYGGFHGDDKDDYINSFTQGSLQERMDAVERLHTRLPAWGSEHTRERHSDWVSAVYDGAKIVLEQELARDPDAVYQQATHADLKVRRAVLEVLGATASKGDERAISCCHAQLRKFPDEVFESLAQLTHPGDPRTIEAVGCVLDTYSTWSNWRLHLDESGKLGRRLPEIAQKDDENLVRTVCKRLEHRENDAREAAAAALKIIASKDAEHVVQEICKRLNHKRAEVREVALRALGQMALPNNLQAVDGARRLLEDKSRKLVRPTAESTLALLEGRNRPRR
ncbi:unnamed protein product [Symbiodinium natans]|uniref:HEAT repeat domain-containing protein n=1 Tax=Symbiodinium natans TaxID=878477 RepID=A0A812NGR1_9DINO|nr:unnamed protein product [Symbiodinium natans]